MKNGHKYNLVTYTGMDIALDYREGNQPVCFLIGTPLHSNIGDRAIAHAEIEFISNMNKRWRIVEVPYGTDTSALDVRENDTLILHGGGNFGDIWPEEEEYRQRVITQNWDKRIILMPQTIFFSNQDEMSNSGNIYSKCKNLTLLAREKASYEIMKKNFKHNKIVLIPDIVLSLRLPQLVTHRNQRNYALFIVRNDVEKTIPDSYTHRAEDVLKYETGINNFIYSDMHCDDREAMMNSHQFITEYKIKQFRRAKIVITDRLHGMIFAAITGTPCLVFGSKTPKTIGTYEILKGTRAGRYIKLCDDVNDISGAIHSIDLEKTYSRRLGDLGKQWSRLTDIIIRQ